MTDVRLLHPGEDRGERDEEGSAELERRQRLAAHGLLGRHQAGLGACRRVAVGAAGPQQSRGQQQEAEPDEQVAEVDAVRLFSGFVE